MDTTLNPGIAYTVQVLREHGFNTTDSGDGETHDFECDLPIPYVHMIVDKPGRLVSQADRLAALLESKGVVFEGQDHTGTKPEINAHYSPGGHSIISLYNVRLSEP